MADHPMNGDGTTTPVPNSQVNTGPNDTNYDPELFDKPEGLDAPSDVPSVQDPGDKIGDGPPVPALGSGGSATSVDTSALRTVATNVTSLCEAAKTSFNQLDVDVHAGGFAEANTLSKKVNELGSDYRQVLQSLSNGLADLSTAMTTLATKYDDTEDDNSVKGEDATKAMESATKYFDAMATPPTDSGAPAPP